jgi:WD40 repeat protein
LYNINEKRLLETYKGHTAHIFSIDSFKPYKHSCFISCSYDKSIRIYNKASSHPLLSINHNVIVYSVINVNKYTNKAFIAGDYNGNISLYNISNDFKASQKQIKGNDSQIYVIVHVDKEPFNLILTSHDNGQVCLWDLNLLKLHLLYDKEYNAIKFSNNIDIRYYKDDIFITGSYEDKKVKMWTLHNSKSIFTFVKFNSSIWSICLLKEAELLLVSLSNNSVLVLDLITKKEMKEIKNEAVLDKLRIYPNSMFQFVRIGRGDKYNSHIYFS